MPQVVYTYNLLPKQRRFARATEDEVCYSGGFGGGKTRALLIKMAHIRGRDRRMVGFVLRQKLDDVMQTVLPTLFEPDGDQPPVLPPGTYVWNKSERFVRLHTGAMIRYAGLGDKRRNDLDRMTFRGHNITDIGIDQAEEISEKQYLNALGRLRSSGAGLTRQAYMTANPAAPSHWIAKRFGIRSSHNPMTTGELRSETEVTDDRTGAKVKVTRLAVLTCPMENPHLPPDYLARLATFTGTMRARYVEGRWVGSEGAVYPMFDRAVHLRQRSGPWARTIVGLDDGMTHPAAFLLGRVDEAGRLHIERSVVASGLLMEAKMGILREFTQDGGIVVCDPSNAQLKAQLRSEGIPVFDGRNEREYGIQVTRDRMALGIDGVPMLTIDPDHNERLVEQIEGYCLVSKGDKEVPVEVDDDGPSALRYMAMHLHAPPPAVFDARGLAAQMAHAERQTPATGELSHHYPTGRERDRSIRRGQAECVGWQPMMTGRLRVWCSMRGDRPADGTEYVLFAAVADGEGSRASVVVVGDVARRSVAAEWVGVEKPEVVARQIAMMSMWFRLESAEGAEAAGVGYVENGAGRMLRQSLASLRVDASAWKPSPKEFAEAVSVLRGAWEGGMLVEPCAESFREALQYVWSGQTVMHAGQLADTSRRAVWADRVMARAGLWWMMSDMEYETGRAARPGSHAALLAEAKAQQRDAGASGSSWR